MVKDSISHIFGRPPAADHSGTTMAPKKPKVNSTPATKKSAPKKNPTKATSKAGTVNKEEREDISDKPAGNTRAADKKRSAEVSSKPAGKTVTDTAKKSNDKPPKARGKTSAATREPTPEPDSSPSEEAIRLPSPKRKRETADKWTETTDLPVPKYPKLDEGM